MPMSQAKVDDNLLGLCASGLARKALADIDGGGGGMICGGEEYSNAYEGRRPSRRLPSRRTNEHNKKHVDAILLSYQSLLAIRPASSIVISRIRTDINISCTLIGKQTTVHGCFCLYYHFYSSSSSPSRRRC